MSEVTPGLWTMAVTAFNPSIATIPTFIQMQLYTSWPITAALSPHQSPGAQHGNTSGDRGYHTEDGEKLTLIYRTATNEHSYVRLLCFRHVAKMGPTSSLCSKIKSPNRISSEVSEQLSQAWFVKACAYVGAHWDRHCRYFIIHLAMILSNHRQSLAKHTSLLSVLANACKDDN